MAELFELHDNIPFAWSPLSSITFSQGNTFKSINMFVIYFLILNVILLIIKFK